MKKTTKMATVTRYNRLKGTHQHIDRRVFENERGEYFVRINRTFIAVAMIEGWGWTVDIWF